MSHDQVDLSRTEFMNIRERLREVEEERDAIRMEADTDALTGLMNRRGLARRMQHRTWGWFVAIDLDGFKRAQDAHPEGHAYGDTILQEFAEFMLDNIRSREMRARDLIAGRKGGDEFLVWCETRVGARHIRDRMREWRSEDGVVGASAGLGADQEAADAACYANKQERKDQS